MSAARRPLLLRRLPPRLATALWWRWYRHRQDRYAALYESAPLRYAPHISMSLLPGDAISDRIAFTGCIEPELSRRIVTLARRGGLLVDVGANLGYFSLLWCAQHPANAAIAFEPSPAVLERLRRNAERNGLGARIEIVAKAAGRSNGQAWFDAGPAEQTGWGGLAAADTPGVIALDTVTLADVVSARPVAVLKIDAEGADTWVLEGCRPLLERGQVAEVWYEQNLPRMAALGIPAEAAQELLRSAGYQPRTHGRASGAVVTWSARR